MSEVSFDMSGLNELARKMDKLDDRLEKKLIRTGGRAAAAHLRRKLKQRLPKSSGEKVRVWRRDARKGEGNALKGDAEDVHVRDSLGVTVKKGRRSLQIQVGVTGLARAYAHVLEFGSKNMSGNRIWTKAMRGESGAMLKKMADKIRIGLEKI